jgi:hypothetical protein
MTDYRPLTEKEAEIYRRVAKEENDKEKILLWDIEATQAMLERGLEAQYLAQRRKNEAALKSMKNDLEQVRFVLKDALDKLEMGVPIKDSVDLSDDNDEDE